MSHITLPRAVVEQVRETLEKSAVRFFSLAAYISPIESVNGVKPSRGREDVIAALAALDAALAEPEQGNCADGSCNCCWTDKPDAKPEPATDEQITLKYRLGDYEDSFRDGWREAEWFHGIRKEDK